MSIALRDPITITKELYDIRVAGGDISAWSFEDIIMDIKAISIAMHLEITKLEKNDFKNQRALKRIRSFTKALNMLGLRFRTITV